MQRRAFIVHGWGGYPEEAWFPWLKTELEQRDFKVEALSMPHPDSPTIDEWVGHLAASVGKSDEHTYFIGHSMGCQAILRYLASLNDKKAGGAVFVAGFFELSDLESEEDKAMFKPWLTTPIDFEKIKAATRNITAIFSDNDKWVPLERNKQLFEKNLQPEIIIEHNKGHFSEDSGVKELPSALNPILKFSGGHTIL